MVAEALTVEGGGPAPVAAPVSAPESRLPPPPTPPQAPASTAPPAVSLQLPATYVKSQAPTDILVLNADHTFSLQVGAQSFRGTFETDGRMLQLTFPPDTKSTGSLQGSRFIDDNGDTWLLRETSPPAESSGVLRNADVVKMVKAGLSDSIIIATIRGSTCQFDSSPDALIQLKKGGVSDTVLTAIVGAAK
jgi:hypothetical protein